MTYKTMKPVKEIEVVPEKNPYKEINSSAACGGEWPGTISAAL